MIAEAESSADDDRRRECHRHVGDFTLFWTGVYPEALPKLRAGTADDLIDFPAQGKRSYYLASTYQTEEAPGPPPPERRVRALRLRPLASPPRMGAPRRPSRPRGPIRPLFGEA